jgi:Tol biopolymer transport system component
VGTSDRWQRVERLYHAALALDESERTAFLRDASGADEPLRREVESLLAYASGAESFMQAPAIEAVERARIQSDTMSQPLVGQRLGPYEIRSLLGAGGMGDVYRARDTKLGRDVAIKILPHIFIADADRRARFEREARLLAALNHPHIAAIYGFEDRDGIHGLVLELVEGQTLAERLRAGALPIAETLTIARQIAEAVAAAHEKGIVHRDLKPANVVITPDGVVKVLDFGLAKARAEGAAPVLTHSPTITESGTRDGVILGTAAYMSPEQARGKVVDKRTDIWAFGCVVWEMLTGRKAFAGETVSDTIAAVLQREPDWRLLPAAMPASLTRLLRRCLEKDPARRLHDIGDVRIEIDEALEVPAATAAADARLPARRANRRLLVAVATVASLSAILAAVAIYFLRPPDAAMPTRLSVSTPGLISPQLSATISPDGRHLAFVSTGGSGKLMLWIRALHSLDARVLPGTENAAHPFWSPDGRFLGFLADGKVKKVAAAGGPIQTLTETGERAGPSWSRDGKILFISRIGELATMPADGGAISTVIAQGPPGRQATWPHFLPDGRHFLYFNRSAQREERGVYLGSVDSKETRQLLQSEFKAAYASGYLLFVRGETLMAQAFDAERLELTGQPARVADGIWVATGAGQASFSVSQTGVLAYVNASRKNIQLAWFDRAGRSLGPMGQPTQHSGPPQLSPDGTRLAIAQGLSANEHVWLTDVAGGTSSRITFGAIRDQAPVWSADGGRIAYQSRTGRGSWRLYLKHANGAGGEELLFETDNLISLEDWSPDSHFLVYTRRGEQSLSDLWLVPLSGDRQPVLFLQSAFNKTQAQISPDGRWIAYTSYEMGGDEVYLQSFPTPGSKRQVSVGGGVQPRWRQDGKELFYLASDQRMMAVPVRMGATLEIGAPTPLFRTRLFPHGSQSIGLHTLYDVSPDGQRFVCYAPPAEEEPPITVVLNWMAALKDDAR